MPRTAILALLIFAALAQACQRPAPPPAHAAPGAPTAILVSEQDSLAGDLLDLDQSDRENWQRPQIVISSLGDLHDKVVADIGAGTGYFTMPLARLALKVIAIDIEQEFLDHIQAQVGQSPDREALNIETRITDPYDPALKAGEADIVLLVNTYAFIDKRVEYFRKVHQGLRPGGELVVVDFKYENLPVGPPMEEKIAPSRIVSELDTAGFSLVRGDSTSLEFQYILRFGRP